MMVRRQGWQQVLRDGAVVAAIAVLGFHSMRRWLGDVYPVPSVSMEPTLHGAARGGDRVFVAKSASPMARRRHDLVVVRHPTEPGQQMVKRIAAIGDDASACWIDLRDGDVWLGADRQRLAREQKDPLEARDLRVPWAVAKPPFVLRSAHLDLQAARPDGDCLALPGTGSSAEDLRSMFGVEARTRRLGGAGGWQLPAACLGTARAVDAGYLAADGTSSPYSVGVQDCGLDFVARELPEELLLTVEALGEALSCHWRPASGQVQLWRNGLGVADATITAVQSGRHRIEFGRLDDRIFLLVDGDRDKLAIFPRQADWTAELLASGLPPEPRTHLHLVVPGARHLAIEGLLVFRDLLAQRDRNLSLPGTPGDWPRFVPPGHWFLLGDNCFDSRDSRSFDAVPASSFLGRPLGVVGPWPRHRWL